MVKRTYIPCAHKNNHYKLYTDDIKSIHKRARRNTPKLPPYDPEDSGKRWDELT